MKDIRWLRVIIILAVIGVIVFLLTSCGAKDDFDTRRGRGDAGVATVDDTPKDVIQMPDRFSNVATACYGDVRLFVTTKSDQSRALFAVLDPLCKQ